MAERGRLADRWGTKLFLPALVIPVVTAVFATLLKNVHVGGQPLLEAENETIIGLGVASVLAVGVGMWLLREHRPVVPLHEGRRLLENIGWAATLPQLLAMLGLVFATAGVGDAIGDVADNATAAVSTGKAANPMAANFNIVPVALLDLKSDYAVIRAQLPTAVPLLACNVLIMYFFAF